MPPPPAFIGARLDFLSSQLEGLTEAIANGTSQEFMSTVYARFFKLFDERKPNDVEPPKEMIDSVMKEDAEWEELVPPVRRAGQDDKAYAEEKKAFDDYHTAVLARMAQIRRWMGYRCIKKNANLEAHSVLLNGLAGITTGKPGKKSTGYNLWYQETGKVLEDEINARHEQLKAEAKEDSKAESAEDGTKKSKGVAYVMVRQDIVKREFEKLPLEERKMWQEKAGEDHKEKVEAWEKQKKAEFSKLPQDRQRAIDLLPSWVMPILDGIQQITGLNCSLWAAGPMPADQGRVNVMGIHSGRTIATDSSPAVGFGTRYRSGIKKFIVPMYGDFCLHTHTAEDFKASSLGVEAKLGSVLTEDAELSFDRWSEEERAEFLKRKGKNTSKASTSQPDASASDTKHDTKLPTVTGASSSKAAANVASGLGNRSGSTKQRALPTGGSSGTSTQKSTPSLASLVASTGASVAKDGLGGAPVSQSIQRANANTESALEKFSAGLKSFSYSDAARKSVKGADASSSSSKKTAAPLSTSSKSVTTSVASSSVSTTTSKSAADRDRPTSSKTSLLELSGGPPSALNVEKLKAAGTKAAVKPSVGGSTTAVLRLRGAERSRTGRMATTGGLPPRIPPRVPPNTLQNVSTSRSSGSARSPIALSSSPASPGPVIRGGRVRRRASSVEILNVPSSPSSRASSPIPSPTRYKRRRISPSESDSSPSRASSPATRLATPHTPMRPDYVGASSPVPSSQPRSISAPPESPVRHRKSAGKVHRKRAESIGSSGSADEISAALANPDSSPVKASAVSRSRKSSKATKRKAEVMEHVEIPPRKKVRASASSASKRSSSAKASSSAKSKEGKKTVPLLLPVPEDAPDYVEKALELFSARDMGSQSDKWSAVVEAWLALEVIQEYQETSKLTAVDRPEVISKWIGQARRPTYKPSPPIVVEDIRKSFLNWWLACLPEWRVGKGKTLIRGKGDWEELRLTGQNGIVSVVAALGWWLEAVMKLPREHHRQRQLFEEERDVCIDALKDVLYSLREMAE
ncbi:SERTA domain-containing protein 3 [Marasmius crinis-equi]|uniref:SERTA domain-containing protein 3 n=1 Tax=Marasmius crinis-equi TaxID=585013 RepID=A0ABR3EP77_9AGAR